MPVGPAFFARDVVDFEEAGDALSLEKLLLACKEGVERVEVEGLVVGETGLLEQGTLRDNLSGD